MQLEKVAVLKGATIGKGFVRATSDRIFLVRYYATHEVVVFDWNGNELNRFGRSGVGPKEFNRIVDLIPLESSAAVFQADPPRLTYVDFAGRVLETHPLPIAVRAGGVEAMPDSTFLLMGSPTSTSRIGSAFVKVDREGKLLQEFGVNHTETEGPLKGRIAPRLLAYDPSAGIISVKRHWLDVEQWHADGAVANRLKRDIDWLSWPPPREYLLGHRLGPPENAFVAASVDGTAQLWLVAVVTPENWQSGIRGNRVIDEEAWKDSRIEVIDLATGDSLCSIHMDLVPLQGFVGPGHVATYSEDAIGQPTIFIWTLSIPN